VMRMVNLRSVSRPARGERAEGAKARRDCGASSAPPPDGRVDARDLSTLAETSKPLKVRAIESGLAVTLCADVRYALRSLAARATLDGQNPDRSAKPVLLDGSSCGGAHTASSASPADSLRLRA